MITKVITFASRQPEIPRCAVIDLVFDDTTVPSEYKSGSELKNKDGTWSYTFHIQEEDLVDIEAEDILSCNLVDPFYEGCVEEYECDLLGVSCFNPEIVVEIDELGEDDMVAMAFEPDLCERHCLAMMDPRVFNDIDVFPPGTPTPPPTPTPTSEESPTPPPTPDPSTPLGSPPPSEFTPTPPPTPSPTPEFTTPPPTPSVSSFPPPTTPPPTTPPPTPTPSPTVTPSASLAPSPSPSPSDSEVPPATPTPSPSEEPMAEITSIIILNDSTFYVTGDEGKSFILFYGSPDMPNSCRLWFNTGTEVAPVNSDNFTQEVTIGSSASAEDIAGTLASILETMMIGPTDPWSASSVGTTVTVTDSFEESRTDAVDVDAGVSITVIQQGNG